MHIIYLPATEPGDPTYGAPPPSVEGFPHLVSHEIQYDAMVWYNEQIRAEAKRQILALGLDRIVLVGFSKSGLGAWHLACDRDLPVTATIIFDTPFAHAEIPVQWGAGPFYDNVDQWRRELPIHRAGDLIPAGKGGHRLVLVSGASFDADMADMASQLDTVGCPHTFIRRPDLTHHWNSGWLDLALATF